MRRQRKTSVGVDAHIDPAECNRKIARVFSDHAQRPVGADDSVRPWGNSKFTATYRNWCNLISNVLLHGQGKPRPYVTTKYGYACKPMQKPRLHQLVQARDVLTKWSGILCGFFLLSDLAAAMGAERGVGSDGLAALGAGVGCGDQPCTTGGAKLAVHGSFFAVRAE